MRRDEVTEISPDQRPAPPAGPAGQRAAPTASRAVGVWLFVIAALIALMVLAGGATRLTDSGLSITEWRPVTGALPPLTAESWTAEFEKYKQIPEYAYVNRGMSLAEFKAIYWWEWGHRFLGRLVGLVFLAPLLWFLYRRRIEAGLAPRLFLIFALGGAQGLLGWLMVKSGLADRVDVSAARLAAHLGLALIIFALTLWTALELTTRRPLRPHANYGPLAGAATIMLGLVFFQMLLGALVAGNDAGRIHTTWPLMDGGLVPAGYFAHTPWIANFFDNAGAVQFNHRLIAYAVGGAAVWLWLKGRGRAMTPALAGLRAGVAGAVGLQIMLGIITLLNAAPLALALAHQGLGLILFALVVAYAQAAQRIYRGQ